MKPCLALFPVFFCVGLILAGSEGPYFPLPNVIGVLLFAAGALLIAKNKEV